MSDQFTNDYFSDDDDKDQTNENLDDINEYDSDDSLDEETKRIIFKSANKNIDWNEFSTQKLNNNLKESPQYEKPTKPKNVLTLGEFIQKVSNTEKKNQPKKFVSRRAEDKKKQTGGIQDTRPRRSFNPRLPPYNFVHKKTAAPVINTTNQSDFPQLNNSVKSNN
jgi:hypothetical protein